MSRVAPGPPARAPALAEIASPRWQRALRRRINSFANAAVRRAAPAVVSITASKTTLRKAAGNGTSSWQRDFFGNAANPSQTGLGSGVLVSPAGYLLTNSHVVDGADDIEVTLSDGRAASATVAGTDADSDLALLKITLDNVPVIPFGNMAQLSVGDPVLAIGNPFNVGQTVTSGIVSALDRNQLGLTTIENFIQTDAADQPGQLGQRALVDGDGRLVEASSTRPSSRATAAAWASASRSRSTSRAR